MATNWNNVLAGINNASDILAILRKVLALLDGKVDLTKIDDIVTDLTRMQVDVDVALTRVNSALSDFDSESQAAIQEVISSGLMEGFTTEAELLATRPTVLKKYAKAEDTNVIWFWNKPEGAPDDNYWTSTGLSELERAKDFAAKLVQASIVDGGVKAEQLPDSEISISSNGVGYAVGVDFEAATINYIDLLLTNLKPTTNLTFKVYERQIDGSGVLPGSLSDKLISSYTKSVQDLVGYNLINSSLLKTRVKFTFPSIVIADKKRILFEITSSDIFSIATKTISPPDTGITNSLGGFYKNQSAGWGLAQLGQRRIAYTVGYTEKYLKKHQKVFDVETEIARTSSDGILFFHTTSRNWTCFGKGFSTFTDKKFNRIGLWLANLSNVSKLKYQIFARPISIASEITWIGASIYDREIYKSCLDITGKYEANENEHLINFDFDTSLLPDNHFLMILVVGEKVDGSVATFGSAARTDTSTSMTRVDRGVWLIDNKEPSYAGTDVTYPFVLTNVSNTSLNNSIYQIKEDIKKIEADKDVKSLPLTPIFKPVLKTEINNLTVNFAGTVILQADLKTVINTSTTHEPSTSGNTSVVSTLNKSTAEFWISNPNEFLGYCNISNVVVTNNADSTVLTKGLHYEVDNYGGKLIGLTDTVYNVTVAFTYTNQRYDLVQVNPFTLSVSVKKGVERRQDPSEWMVEVDPPCRALCRVLITGNQIEIVPLDEYINCGGKPYISSAEYNALKLHNQASLKRIFAKLNKGQNISLVGYGDSITAMGGYHTEDVPNENHDWYGFFATLPQDTRDAKVPTFNYESGLGGRMHTGWNWKLKEFLEKSYANTVMYWNYGVSGTDSTDGARDTRLQYPLSKNPDLVVVGFGMNDFGNSVLYSNLVKIVNTFKNSGSDVVLMPVIRTPTLPLVNYQGEDWRKVNRFVYSAAIDSGAAYCPIDWYVDDAHYGGMGINFKHFCTQNMFNHPGPYEYSIYGKILVSLFE
ncbi:SGNH/GDSL hydrolase family protein [Acinetobacter seifertii]|uniref:SGNH/GDSL hydrolase family protein n=1 Tax=Acinetobacter seifertii TaxID=1530123 RepID=UPI0032B57EAF